MKNLLIIFTLTILSLCCTEKFKETEAKNTFIINSSATFKGYFYIGSDKAHHFFVSKWSPGRDDYFKVKKESLEITDKFQFESDSVRVYVVKPTVFPVKKFCKINHTSRVIYQNK